MRACAQEAGQLRLSDLAVQYALNTELLASTLQSRISDQVIKVLFDFIHTSIHVHMMLLHARALRLARTIATRTHSQTHEHNCTQGRLEAGLLYTSSYLRNIKAVLRGALRGVAEPTTMGTVVKVRQKRGKGER